MKKVFACSLICIMAALTLTLTACGDKNGSYYPSNAEMKTNLEKDGYTVNVATEFDGKSVAYLEAKKGQDFIYFFRPTDAEDCAYFYQYLENHCSAAFAADTVTTDYNLVKIENDKKYGNIVYCGTTAAIKASGIKVVKVSVKV